MGLTGWSPFWAETGHSGFLGSLLDTWRRKKNNYSSIESAPLRITFIHSIHVKGPTRFSLFHIELHLIRSTHVKLIPAAFSLDWRNRVNVAAPALPVSTGKQTIRIKGFLFQTWMNSGAAPTFSTAQKSCSHTVKINEFEMSTLMPPVRSLFFSFLVM